MTSRDLAKAAATLRARLNSEPENLQLRIDLREADRAYGRALADERGKRNATPTPPEIVKARKALANLRGVVRRTGITGRNARGARTQYEDAFAAVLAVEDAFGIEAAATLSARLTELYSEARAARLLSNDDIVAAERAAVERIHP